MKAAVIVLNWNDAKRTSKCLESLRIQSVQDFKIFLLDNGSEHQDREQLEHAASSFQNLEAHYYEDNLGFTGAHLKLWESGTLDDFENIVLLNNDAIAEENWLEELITTSEAKGLDMAASMMIQMKEPSRVDSFGLFMLNTGEILPKGFGQEVARFSSDEVCIGPSGGACLYSTNMLKSIGWFDPHFNTGYEDAEFALRAFSAGYSCEALVKARVSHEGSVSIAKVRDRSYLTYVQKSIWYSYFKNMPPVFILWNFPSILFKYIFILAMYTLTFNASFLQIHLSSFAYLFSSKFRRELRVQKSKKASFAKALEATQFFLLFDIQRFAQLFKKSP